MTTFECDKILSIGNKKRSIVEQSIEINQKNIHES